MNDVWVKATKIISKLLKGENINKKENKDLLQAYIYEAEVASVVQKKAEIHEIEVYLVDGDDIVAVPKMNNSSYIYSNTELKSIWNLRDNKDVYVCYYIMSVLLRMFYKDSNGRQIMEHIGVMQLVEKVDAELNVMKQKNESKEKDSVITDGIEEVLRLWFGDLSDVNLKSSKNYNEDFRSRSKVAFANRVLRLLVKDGFLILDTISYRYMPTPKFKAVVKNVYCSCEYMDMLNRILEDTIDIIEYDNEMQ